MMRFALLTVWAGRARTFSFLLLGAYTILAVSVQDIASRGGDAVCGPRTGM